jgi:hypothetical protein
VRRRAAALAALSLAAAGAFGPAAPAQAAHRTGPQPGVNLDLAQAADPAVQQQLQAAGARWLRFFMTWPAVEPQRGIFDEGLLATMRRVGQQLHARGMKLQVVFTRSPSWASGIADPIAPPVDPADYGAALGHVAAATRGAVDAWEIWNEPDTKDFWRDGPQPERYVALLRAGAAAVRANDPAATVILGPLTGNNYVFLERVYALGARRDFDAVSVHTDTGCLLAGPTDYFREPDGRISQWSFLGFKTVRAVMAAHGDARKPLFMTEFGWSATRTVCDRGVWKGRKRGGVGPTLQARYLRQAWHCLADQKRIAGAFWFNYRDATAADTHDGRYGLLAHDGSPKPAWRAFVGVARHGDRLRGPCGDFVAPRIRVRRQGGTVRVTATDAAGVRKIEIRGGGRRLRYVSVRSSPKTLHAKARYRGAVTVKAGDRFGNKRVLRLVSAARAGRAG